MNLNFYDSMGTPTFAQFTARLGNWNAKALEAMTIIRGAANYSSFIVGMPKPGQQTIASRGVFRGNISLGNRAYILGVSGYAENAAGFRLQLRDLGTGKNLFVTPLNMGNCCGEPTGTPHSNVHYFPRPHMVKDPGMVEVQIYSLATVAQDIEIALHTAIETYDMTEALKD